MKRYFLLICAIFFARAYACDVTDDAGHVLHLSQPAKRIVSLAPDLTEMLFASGAGQKIVGVMQGSDYPSDARLLPVIASYNSLNREALLSLHPDLIIAWSGNSPAALAWFHELKIPVFVSHQRELQDIPATLRKFGCLAGSEKTAEIAANHFSQQLEKLRLQYQHQKQFSVFYEVSTHPLMTINHDSWINQVITLCGGRNIFAKAKVIAPVVSREAVIALDPDFIIGKDVSDWQEWKQMRAIKAHHLISMDVDLLERAGPRILEGAEILCKISQKTA